MSNYSNENKGTIAKNTRKTEDNHPDIAGSINVNGTDYWLNGWLKTNSRDGSKFYSLTVKPKQERAQEIRRDQYGRVAPKPEQPSGRMELDDEIPF